MTGELLLQGMHGMGDTIHERGLVRQLLRRFTRVWLETSWPCIFHDLVGDSLVLLPKWTHLRTQTKNANRERDQYTGRAPPVGIGVLQPSYTLPGVQLHGSVVGAMAASIGCDPAAMDFRLPVPQRWQMKAEAFTADWPRDKPLLIFRPLTVRREWGGCVTRNPDHGAYTELYRAIRQQFFTVSIADLAPNQEWLVAGVSADRTYHEGELSVELLAALFARAALVFTAPGFATILAQAVGTPYVCVFGGYQNAMTLNGGTALPPHLDIEPIKPCLCFQHCGTCSKAIDLPQATKSLERFARDVVTAKNQCA